MSTDEWVDQMAHANGGILSGNKRGGSAESCYNMDDPWKYTKDLVRKSHLLCDSAYIKCSELANSYAESTLVVVRGSGN